MKPSALFAFLPFAASLLLSTACSRSTAEPSEAHAAPPATVYKPGRGLQVSAPAARSAGLQTAEASSRDLGSGETIAVPDAAVLRTIKGNFVFVENGGWFLRTPVKLGTSDGNHTAILEGLYEGDRIVTGGALDLWLAEIQAVNGGVGCADGH